MALPIWANRNLFGDAMNNISTNACFAVFIGLLIASMALQFIRAGKRKKIVQMVDPTALAIDDQYKWHSVEKSFDFLFKDFRKLQIAKRNSERLSNEIRDKLGYYRRFSRVEIFVTVSMLLFGSVAFYICS
jgi:hypothetical protein